MAKKQPTETLTARSRLLVATMSGLIVGIELALMGAGTYAPLAGWDVLAIVYITTTFAGVMRFDGAATKAHAGSENPGRAVGDLLVIVGSIASLVAVGLLIIHAGNSSGSAKAIDIFLGLGSVVVSWALVHTSFLLRYARLYYGNPEGGISFNQSEPPTYSDFAYLAFTLGMTFQVSDTNISNSAIRATILRHCLLSYLFGTVIIATTINTIVTLSS